jgi:hypothetical protein
MRTHSDHVSVNGMRKVDHTGFFIGIVVDVCGIVLESMPLYKLIHPVVGDKIAGKVGGRVDKNNMQGGVEEILNGLDLHYEILVIVEQGAWKNNILN